MLRAELCLHCHDGLDWGVVSTNLRSEQYCLSLSMVWMRFRSGLKIVHYWSVVQVWLWSELVWWLYLYSGNVTSIEGSLPESLKNNIIEKFQIVSRIYNKWRVISWFSEYHLTDFWNFSCDKHLNLISGDTNTKSNFRGGTTVIPHSIASGTSVKA